MSYYTPQEPSLWPLITLTLALLALCFFFGWYIAEQDCARLADMVRALGGKP